MSDVVATGSIMLGMRCQRIGLPKSFSLRDTKQIKFTQAQRSRWQTLADIVDDVVWCTPIECSV